MNNRVISGLIALALLCGCSSTAIAAPYQLPATKLNGVMNANGNAITNASDIVLSSGKALSANFVEDFSPSTTNRVYIGNPSIPFQGITLYATNTTIPATGTLLNYGSSSFYGDLAMNGANVTGVGDGTSPSHAVNLGQLNTASNALAAAAAVIVDTGTAYGTNYTATLEYDFTNNVWTTTVVAE